MRAITLNTMVVFETWVDLIATFVYVRIDSEPLHYKSSPSKCGVDIRHTTNDAKEKELA